MSDVAYEPIVVAEPSTELRELGSRMVGRSRLSGGVEGTSPLRVDGGRVFLIQHVDLVQHGMKIRSSRSSSIDPDGNTRGEWV